MIPLLYRIIPFFATTHISSVYLTHFRVALPLSPSTLLHTSSHTLSRFAEAIPPYSIRYNTTSHIECDIFQHSLILTLEQRLLYI